MAEVFRRVQSGPGAGMLTDKAMAIHRKAKWGTRNEAYKGAQRARVALNLYSEVRTGTSGIAVENVGEADWMVWLTDTRGQGAANIIEFGRHKHEGNDSRPVSPLQMAFGANWSKG